MTTRNDRTVSRSGFNEFLPEVNKHLDGMDEDPNRLSPSKGASTKYRIHVKAQADITWSPGSGS